MPQNDKLHSARSTKDDEYYTQYTDIEDEMQHYKPHFKNKTVYCNCDNPDKSNFTRYFMDNFTELQLKSLVSTWYNPDGKSTMATFDGHTQTTTPLEGNGDFRSAECAAILRQSDIIATNPPFSLFRQFMSQLTDSGKKFIIIGNKNAISYKEIFPHIMHNEMWTGYRAFTGGMWFEIPQDSDCKTKKTVNGTLLGNVAACWFTNLEHDRLHTPLQLTTPYSPEIHPKYDNYDAIEVGKTKEIPVDYDGIMGVPITFLDKYCPDQFEIVDINPHFYRLTEQGLPKPKQLTLQNHGMKDPYARILIKKK